MKTETFQMVTNQVLYNLSFWYQRNWAMKCKWRLNRCLMSNCAILCNCQTQCSHTNQPTKLWNKKLGGVFFVNLTRYISCTKTLFVNSLIFYNIYLPPKIICWNATNWRLYFDLLEFLLVYPDLDSFVLIWCSILWNFQTPAS